jgi:hypothetical protein
MKKALLIISLAFVGINGLAQDLKENEFSISLGYMFEGEMYVAEIDQYFSVGETILLRAEFDHYFSDKVGIGAYLSYGSPYYSYVYEEISMIEAGALFKLRFPAGDKFQIKPGVYFGYRSYGDDAGTGFGINANVGIQYSVSEKVKPFFELGILSQPAGGNDDSDVTYGPTFQASIGITF